MTTNINQNVLALLSRLKITQGPNNAAAPFVWLKIEAIGTFKVLFICLDYFIQKSNVTGARKCEDDQSQNI